MCDLVLFSSGSFESSSTLDRERGLGWKSPVFGKSSKSNTAATLPAAKHDTHDVVDHTSVVEHDVRAPADDAVATEGAVAAETHMMTQLMPTELVVDDIQGPLEGTTTYSCMTWTSEVRHVHVRVHLMRLF